MTRHTSCALVAVVQTFALPISAAADTRIPRASLDRRAAAQQPMPEPWHADARQALSDLLLAGHRAIPVIEALDEMGLWTQVLAEWRAVRSKPQRNAYHRFTVDRHLLEAAANAASLVARTDRPDLLVLGALLHDLRSEEHTSELQSLMRN